MTALVASVFVAALLGSVHCAAMCGSFACIAGGRGSPRATDGGWRPAAAYNLGRLVSYMTLGLIAGAAGAGLDRAGAVAGFTRPAAIVAGAMLLLWGLASLLTALGVRVPALDVPPELAAVISRGVRSVKERPPLTRALAIGLLTAALPCGWLYAFVATSSAAGSAIGGALVMAAFWAGTVPAMAAVGFGAQRLLGPFRRRLPMVTAALMMVLGAATIAGRFAVPPAHAGAVHVDHR